MLRFLFYTVVAYLLWIAMTSIFKAVLRGGGKQTKKISGEDLIQCAECGTYVPGSGVVKRKGHIFCGKECAGKFKG